MASLGAQQQELPLPPSLELSKAKRDNNFELASHDAGKCQMSMFLVSQEDWIKEGGGPRPLICTDDLLYIIQAQDVSVGSPEILDSKKKKNLQLKLCRKPVSLCLWVCLFSLTNASCVKQADTLYFITYLLPQSMAKERDP